MKTIGRVLWTVLSLKANELLGRRYQGFLECGFAVVYFAAFVLHQRYPAATAFLIKAACVSLAHDFLLDNYFTWSQAARSAGNDLAAKLLTRATLVCFLILLLFFWVAGGIDWELILVIVLLTERHDGTTDAGFGRELAHWAFAAAPAALLSSMLVPGLDFFSADGVATAKWILCAGFYFTLRAVCLLAFDPYTFATEGRRL